LVSGVTGLGRGGVGIGQVLGALWMLAALGLLIALALDLLASRVTFDPAVMIPLAVMICPGAGDSALPGLPAHSAADGTAREVVRCPGWNRAVRRRDVRA